MTPMLPPAKFISGLCVVAFLAFAGAQVLAAQDPQLADRVRFLQTKSCDNCDLHGQGFDKLDLKGASLSGANLAGSTFYKADLTNANLAGADLTKGVLPFANLTNVNLAGANLTGANLSSAIGADLTAAITTDATTCPSGQAGPCR